MNPNSPELTWGCKVELSRNAQEAQEPLLGITASQAVG